MTRRVTESRQLPAACVATLCFYIGMFIPSAMIPLYAAHIGATTTEIGFIVASNMAVSAVSAVPFGLSSDRLGRKKLILLGSFLSMLSSLLLILSQNSLHLSLMYALGGLGRAAYMPAMHAFVGDIAHSRRSGQAFSLYSASMMMGMALGSSVGGITASVAGYSVMFLCSGTFFLGAIIVSAILKIQSSELPTSKDEVTPRNTKSVRGGSRVWSNLTVLTCWSAEFCLFFGYSISTSFFQLHFRSIDLNLSVIGLIYTLTNASNAVSRLLTGRVSDRLQRRVPFLILGLLLVATTISLVPSITVFHVIVVLMALLGSGTGMTDLSINILMAEVTDSSTRGLAMGVLSTCLFGGFSVGPLLLGGVVENHGLQMASFIGTAVVVGGALSAGCILYISKRKDKATGLRAE